MLVAIMKYAYKAICYCGVLLHLPYSRVDKVVVCVIMCVNVCVIKANDFISIL